MPKKHASAEVSSSSKKFIYLFTKETVEQPQKKEFNKLNH